MWVLTTKRFSVLLCSNMKRLGMISLSTGLPPTDEEVLLSRKQVAKRWEVCTETVKRRERSGLLPPVRFNQRLTRYRLRDVIALEREATK
jgi:hypothetical protein